MGVRANASWDSPGEGSLASEEGVAEGVEKYEANLGQIKIWAP